MVGYGRSPLGCLLYNKINCVKIWHSALYPYIDLMFEGTIQQAPRMHVISVYFRLNLCKLYDILIT